MFPFANKYNGNKKIWPQYKKAIKTTLVIEGNYGLVTGEDGWPQPDHGSRMTLEDFESDSSGGSDNEGNSADGSEGAKAKTRSSGKKSASAGASSKKTHHSSADKLLQWIKISGWDAANSNYIKKYDRHKDEVKQVTKVFNNYLSRTIIASILPLIETGNVVVIPQ